MEKSRFLQVFRILVLFYGTLLPCSCAADMPIYCSSQNPNLPNCAGSVDNLANGRTQHGSSARPGGLLPPWVNLTLATRGQKAVNDFILPVLLSHDYGLTALLAHPDIADVLIFTGNSGSVSDSLLRYQATMTQVLVWYQDLFQPRPPILPILNNILPIKLRLPIIGPTPSPPRDVFISLNNVRNVHIERAQRAANQLTVTLPLIPDTTYENVTLVSALSGPFFQDLANSNIPAEQRLSPPPSAWTNLTALPINQQAQALTQFAFMGFGVLRPVGLGMFPNEEDLWAFTHLWAVFGYAIGVNDEFNVGLQPNLQAAQAYFQEILEKYTIPSLFHLNHQRKVLMERLPFQLLNNPYLNQPLSLNVILYRILTQVLQIDAPLTYATLTLTEQLGEAGLEVEQGLYVTNPITRIITNVAVNSAIYTAGLGIWGRNYTTRALRAQNVYYD